MSTIYVCESFIVHQLQGDIVYGSFYTILWSRDLQLKQKEARQSNTIKEYPNTGELHFATHDFVKNRLKT